MTPGPIPGRISVTLSSPSGLRRGETVGVHVLRELAPGKWAVAVKGRVYPALSDLALEPGAVLRARVGGSAQRLVLTIIRAEPEVAESALATAGLASGGGEELIARALARSDLPLSPEVIQKLKTLIAKSGLDERKTARSAATLVDKRIDPESPGAIGLLKVLAFGQKGGEDPRRYRGRPLPQTPEEVKEHVRSLPVRVEAAARRPWALVSYNHRAGRSQTWVVVPFAFISNGLRMDGTLKILYDPHNARPLALSVCMSDVGVYLPLRGRHRSVSVFCDSPAVRRAAARALETLRPEFNNMGWEVDDTIKEGNAFDGFSPIEEGDTLPRVDTVG